MSQRMFFLVLLATSLLMRLPSLFYPYMNIDEVMWGMHAKAIADGMMPYVHVMGEKPPLLYLFTAAIFWLFGPHNYLAVHLISIVWAALTGLIIFRLLQTLGHRRAGMLAGLLYVVASSVPGFRLTGTSGELIMNLPLVCSTWAFVVGVQRRHTASFFIAGLLVVVAGLVRQQSMIHFGAYLLMAGIYLWRPTRAFGRGETLRGTLGMAVGALIGLGACFWYIVAFSDWSEFASWTMGHNADYIRTGFLNSTVLLNLSWRGGYLFALTFPLWVYAACRVRRRLQARDVSTNMEWLALAWLCVSLVATTPGGRFYAHYFVQAYPALCILAALEWTERSAKHHTWRQWLRRPIVITWLLIILISKILIPWERQLGTNGDYSGKVQLVGEYVKAHTEPSDTIFVWGWAAGLYMFAERDPGSRLISTDFLTGRSPSQDDTAINIRQQRATKGAWNKVFKDLMVRKPVYIIDTSPGNYHGYNIYPISAYPALQNYIAKYYALEHSLHGMDLYRRVDKHMPAD